MPRPVVLVSKEKITRSEFMQFLKTCGAEKSDDDVRCVVRIARAEHIGGIYDGYLYNNDTGVLWVMYAPEEELSGSELEAKIKNIIPKLGSPPQTEILLDIGKNVPSEILAAEFVELFDQIWPCVVDTLPNVYSVPGVAHLRDDLTRDRYKIITEIVQ